MRSTSCIQKGIAGDTSPLASDSPEDGSSEEAPTAAMSARMSSEAQKGTTETRSIHQKMEWQSSHALYAAVRSPSSSVKSTESA